jgi:cell division protein FtsN
MNETRKMNRGGFKPRPSGWIDQRGGFAVGLIVGLLIGLGLALGVALYVTKVPVPFVNKVPQRTAGQDAAEAEKNKNWDPNSPLSGKNPARPNSAASGVVAPPSVAAPSTTITLPQSPQPQVATTPSTRASDATGARDPAAILADKPPASAPTKDALKDVPKVFSSASAAGGPDPFSYFVQAGAYGRTEDAEQQRAKLAMMGVEGKLTERDQAGRMVYRVRVGPFDKKPDADAVRERLVAAGVEAALVRVQR